jgi:hypothetical protein
MPGIRDAISFVLDVIRDIPKLIAMLSIPVSNQPTADRLKALHLSGLLGIIGCAMVVAATMAHPTTVDVITFVLVALIFPAIASWLYSLALRNKSVIAKNSNALDDSLSLVIAINLVGIAIFAAARLANMFSSDPFSVSEINTIGLFAGALLPSLFVFVRSVFAAGSTQAKIKFLVALLSILLAAEVFVFLKVVIFFTG